MRDPATSIALPMRYGSQVAAAIREEREAVGIPFNVLPGQASAALAAAVGPLQSGDQAAIRSALSNPVFSLGPDATLERLTNLPRMWMMESITINPFQCIILGKNSCCSRLGRHDWLHCRWPRGGLSS